MLLGHTAVTAEGLTGCSLGENEREREIVREKGEGDIYRGTGAGCIMNPISSSGKHRVRHNPGV